MRKKFAYQWKISNGKNITDIKSQNETIRTRRGSISWGQGRYWKKFLPSGQLNFSGKPKQAAADLTALTSHKHQFYVISESYVIVNSRSVNVSLGSLAWPDDDATAACEMERIYVPISLANDMKSIIFITFTEESQEKRENVTISDGVSSNPANEYYQLVEIILLLRISGDVVSATRKCAGTDKSRENPFWRD